MLSALCACPAQNMNGFPYKIANPNTNGKWTGEFAQIDPTLQYFDVYSPPITTRYAQVFWTMMDPVPLPADVVSRFANKTMAIRGYECNQVMKSEDGDIPVPINAAYNHHHGATIKSKHAVLKKVPATAEDSMLNHGAQEVWKTEDMRPPSLRTGPSSVVLHEGNGGEFRQSYHGYPKGYAQLVESPETFSLQPMQIDTWNRNNNYTAGRDGGVNPFNMSSRPRGKFVPFTQPRNSVAPRDGTDAIYSGLLECPCTDRITKIVDGAAAVVKTEGHCAPITEISSAASCHSAAASSFTPLTAFGMKVDPTVHSINSTDLPAGCYSIIQPQPATPDSPFHEPANATVYFNTRSTSTAQCGAATPEETTLWGGSKKNSLDNLGFWVEVNYTTLLLTLSGPDDVWHGIGFNSSTMAAGTYAIVVEGVNGTVSEHQLGTQAPGTTLPPSAGLRIYSQDVSGGRRVTRVAVSLAALSGHHISFDAMLESASLPVITAIGSTATFAYHKSKSNHILTLFPLDAPSCLCAGGSSNSPFGQGKGQLIYSPVANEPGGKNSTVPGAGATSLHFAKRCLQFPSSTMLLGKNPSCDIRAYTGGQSCCHHLFTLLDKDQVTPWQDQPLVYHHKWRIWYTEVETSPTPITDLVQFNWGGMASPIEVRPYAMVWALHARELARNI